VSAVSGDTRDKSQYFTAFRAVIVVTAFMSDDARRIPINSILRLLKSTKNINGNNKINEKSLVPQARVYSSSESFFLISVNDFQASSHSDLINATTRAKNIQIIISRCLCI